MAQVTGRPMPAGAAELHASVRGLDRAQHPQHNIAPRAVRPVNYSPLGPSTLHVGKALKPQKLK